jgi:hypothetical protein
MLTAPFTPTACFIENQTLNDFTGLNQIIGLIDFAALCITSRKVGAAHFSVRSVIVSYGIILA